ncbi:protein GET1 isoform X2 [Humulus lupulus]|uniref:protein GET1 isoform X2 n=1 Tax=Humulus lupulus TaxID=3486 RepID=UPI002B410792|nr:protein GET1 isoform X2 [Humulus lupulus]
MADSSEEALEVRRGSVAATLIFTIVIAFQFISRWLEHLKKKGSKTATEVQLREEIKKLMKEASSLSQPSTFAQAAKLRRMAVAKEKELMNYQESHKNELKVSCELYLKVFFAVKVLTYLVLVCWFWRVPVATISEQLVQPFGRNHTLVNIIYKG